MFSLIPWKRKKDEASGGEIAAREASPLVRFRQEVDALFDRFFREGPNLDRIWKGWPARTGEDWSLGWGFDVDDRPKEIVVRAEAPGFDPQDFDVHVSGNRLVIQAEHKQQSNSENGFSYRYGTLHRVIPLPNGIKEDKIDARYRRGVLQVSVPKGERAAGKRIAVRSP